MVDMRAVSGHTKADKMAIYDKVNAENSRKIVTKPGKRVNVIEGRSA